MLVIPPIHFDHTQSILIVDDDNMILDLLSELFKKLGLNVFKAENGLVGWNLFEKECIDIVITDVCMPGLDGIELSKRIRNQSPDTKIAVMTGGRTDAAEELLKDETVNYLFKKPFSLSFVGKYFKAEAQMM